LALDAYGVGVIDYNKWAKFLGGIFMAKAVCWHFETVTATRVGAMGTIRGIKASAPCARTLKDGKCPKHGKDIK
jgi:hypothetical protein